MPEDYDPMQEPPVSYAKELVEERARSLPQLPVIPSPHRYSSTQSVCSEETQKTDCTFTSDSLIETDKGFKHQWLKPNLKHPDYSDCAVPYKGLVLTPNWKMKQAQETSPV